MKPDTRLPYTVSLVGGVSAGDRRFAWVNKDLNAEQRRAVTRYYSKSRI